MHYHQTWFVPERRLAFEAAQPHIQRSNTNVIDVKTMEIMEHYFKIRVVDLALNQSQYLDP